MNFGRETSLNKMIDKVIVIGISAGGRTALHFAKNYPN